MVFIGWLSVKVKLDVVIVVDCPVEKPAKPPIVALTLVLITRLPVSANTVLVAAPRPAPPFT